MSTVFKVFDGTHSRDLAEVSDTLTPGPGTRVDLEDGVYQVIDTVLRVITYTWVPDTIESVVRLREI